MPNNILVKDANADNQSMRTIEVAGVHTPVHRVEGYDPGDDMLKVKSVQKKWRDSFTRPLTDIWDVVSFGGSSASVSGGVLTIASGTTAGGFVELLSKETFTIPFRAMFGVQNTRNANNHHIVEAISVDAVTGVPDGRHCIQMDIGGAASMTATQMLYYVQNGGLAPLASAAATIVSTAAYSILELEPFADEAYVHSRTLDATTGRSNSYVRHQQIPDPTALYKLRVRSMNHAAWRSVSGAVAGTGGVIRLTSTAHGYATSNTVWVECLNGVLNGTSEVRGNYVITVVDANTIELNGTTFAGTYATGSGRVALAAAPTAVNLQFQFANCQDYAELTAEITAGRGQSVEGQAIAARLVPGTSSIGSVAINTAMPAGTAMMGDVGVQYRTNATGAASFSKVLSAAGTNATVVKAAGGRLLGYSLGNNSAAWRYVKLYNVATAPTAGAGTIVGIIPIPPNGHVHAEFPGGLGFSNGIAMTIVTGAADADATATTANDVSGFIAFS